MAWQLPVPAPPDLAGDVACAWSATVEGRHRLMPDGCMDVLWLDTGAIVVCGPDTGAWDVSLPPGHTAVGVRFRPGAAPRALRTPAHELVDRRVGFDEVSGSGPARAASDRIGEADDRVAAIVDVLRPLVRRAVAPDPVERAVVHAAARFRPVASTALADEVGLTTRQLHRRSVRSFGYGPSVLRRIARFQRFLRLVERCPGAPLAELAASAGYHDQAHLARECRSLAGTTPTDLVAGHSPTFPGGSDPYKTT